MLQENRLILPGNSTTRPRDTDLQDLQHKSPDITPKQPENPKYLRLKQSSITPFLVQDVSITNTNVGNPQVNHQDITPHQKPWTQDLRLSSLTPIITPKHPHRLKCTKKSVKEPPVMKPAQYLQSTKDRNPTGRKKINGQNSQS